MCYVIVPGSLAPPPINAKHTISDHCNGLATCSKWHDNGQALACMCSGKCGPNASSCGADHAALKLCMQPWGCSCSPAAVHAALELSSQCCFFVASPIHTTPPFDVHGTFFKRVGRFQHVGLSCAIGITDNKGNMGLLLIGTKPTLCLSSVLPVAHDKPTCWNQTGLHT